MTKRSLEPIMKIFQLNDYEWWFAETLAEAYAEAERQTGVSEKEQREDFEPIEIPESDWDKPDQIRLEEDGKPEYGSYRDVLELVTCDGSKAGLLCGTET